MTGQPAIEAFEDMQTLRHLNLHNNLAFKKYFVRNSSIEEGAAVEFPNLFTLNISSLNLGNFCRKLSIKNLRSLDLSKNTFTTIPKYCLPKNSMAYSLHLSENKIKSISKDSFDTHHQYWLADLSFNNIVSFELGSLRHQTFMVELRLQGNQLTNLNSGYPTFPLKLITIDLQSNPWSCGCNLVETILALNPHNKLIKCDEPATFENFSVTELAARDNFTCRPQLCNPPHRILLSFVGDQMVELPCPIIASNITYWSFMSQELQVSKATLPDGVSVLPHNSLLIANVTPKTTGLYTCWGENGAGRTRFTIELLVEEIREDIAESSNLTIMLAKSFSDTLPCGKSLAANNIISHILFILMLAIGLLYNVTFSGIF
ncbi:leucine-rich repeat-containing protein 4C-like [Lytechinus pictus]|uniref:leucine-rich repeat-containing protein 4C-like n=1 Tax=Lytechinus pictus TaxID=7653 RepID=UPI0030B9AEF6